MTRNRLWQRLMMLAAAALLLLSVPAGAEEASENLLFNSAFEMLDEEGVPEGWYTDAYVQEAGYSSYSILEETVEQENRSVLFIQNFAMNDARLAQTVQVRPECLYHLSALVRADIPEEEGHGANLSIEGVYAFSEELFDTDGKWERIDWYGETGPDQQDVTIFLRLGGYSGESMGKAWFTDVTLEEVDSLPAEVVADRWFKLSQPSVYEDTDEEEAASPAWPWLIVISILYAACCAVLLGAFRRSSSETSEISRTGRYDIWVCVGLTAALCLRLIISYFVEGYMVDVNCFTSWGRTMAEYGPSGFYSAVSFCDYPPAYLLILGLNAKIADLTGASAGWLRVIYRFFPSLCDILGCAVLYRAGKRKNAGSTPLLAAFVLMFAFLPVSVLNSAAWGQMDSVLCLLTLLVALWAAEGNWLCALPCYMLAVLVKPQALMLGPLGLLATLCSWIRQPASRKKILLGLGFSLVPAAFIIWLFRGEQPFGWLVQLYAGTLSSYPYATVNTANLYYLLGENWRPIANPASLSAVGALIICSFLYAWLWKKKASVRFKAWGIEFVLTLLFAAWFIFCAVSGKNWTYVGSASMALSFVLVLSLYLRKSDIRFLPFAGALLFILLYVFGIKMHERYLFPAFLLLALSWIQQRDVRLLRIGLALSLCMFLNEGIVLDNSIRLGSSLGHLNADTAWLAGAISSVNILSAFYSVHTGLSLAAGEKAPEWGTPVLRIRQAAAPRTPLTYHPDKSLHWTGRDTVLMTAITAVYAAVSLTTLGSMKAPQSAWVSSSYDEQVILDLGQEHPAASMLYFAQVSMYDFSVAESDDGEHWGDEIWAHMDQQQCWKWKYVTEYSSDENGKRSYYSGFSHLIPFTRRYVRITSHQIGLKLNEVLFKTDSGEVLPARITQRMGGNSESELYSDPAALTDEQDTLEGLPLYFSAPGETDANQPSWWNSTYFDEIYHARTAFEFLRGTVPYETTHPPLGKVLMSWCIALFGMTPFGWRLAGAVAGILMIPGLYLLGKQLTKRTSVAAFCAALIALDCQHLTQTQIATIDSFPVLCIIFAFFFMLRFMQTDLPCAKKSGILLNLAASGFFMGLAIASKWIGIYAGAGLGVLFFWRCFRQIRLSADAQKILNTADLSVEELERLRPYLPSGDHTGRNPGVRITLTLCLWCLLFFVLQPLVIYLLSYLPYEAYNHAIHGPLDYLKAVWQAQISMLNYHSIKELGMDHPFYSPWWQWPIIGKPMYYAMETYELDIGLYHSIFCFGNPVIWFSGLAGLAGSLIFWLRGKRYVLPSQAGCWHWTRQDYQIAPAFILLGFLAQYLPWTLVPRGTYIYHYFASVPFLILSIAFCFWTPLKENRRLLHLFLGIFTALAAVSFILFFPYASGIMAPESWLNIGSKILRIWY